MVRPSRLDQEGRIAVVTTGEAGMRWTRGWRKSEAVARLSLAPSSISEDATLTTRAHHRGPKRRRASSGLFDIQIAHAPVLPAGREGLLAQLGRLFYELFMVSISRRKNGHQPMIVPLTGFARPDHAG